MSQELDFARAGLAAIEEAIAASTVDGPVYEDSYVTVTRQGGKIYMTGKPIRSPFQYPEVSE